MRYWQARTPGILLFILIAGAILFSRFYGLDLKPIHHDESVNMWWVSEIWSEGFFKYDPTNYHGPLLFYLFHWMEALGVKTLEAYRALCSFFNVALIAMVAGWSLRRQNHWWQVALLVALSPAMIFFSRSGIHEMAFVFFQVMAFLGVVDFFKYSKKQGLRLFIWGVLGALLLKETFVLPLIAAAICVPFTKNKFSLKLTTSEKNEFLRQSLGAFLVWVLFYSGFFANFSGLLDFFRAFLPWTTTGVSGSGHEKPIYYWLKLVLNHEPLTLVALVFTVMNLFLRTGLVKLLSIFSLVNLALYSLIPYKTPWCLISIVWPLYFSGLEGFHYFWPRLRRQSQWILKLALIVLGASQLKDVASIAYKVPLQFSHDYMYVQTTPGAKNAFEFIQSQSLSDGVLVFASNPWPFPAVLKDFYQVYPLVPMQDLSRQDLSRLPSSLGVIIMESDPDLENSLLQRLKVQRRECHEVFQEGLGECQFEILAGAAVYQLILVGER